MNNCTRPAPTNFTGTRLSVLAYTFSYWILSPHGKTKCKIEHRIRVNPMISFLEATSVLKSHTRLKAASGHVICAVGMKNSSLQIVRSLIGKRERVGGVMRRILRLGSPTHYPVSISCCRKQPRILSLRRNTSLHSLSRWTGGTRDHVKHTDCYCLQPTNLLRADFIKFRRTRREYFLPASRRLI